MKQGASESPEKLYPGISVPVNSSRVLVCGGRTYWDATTLERVLDTLQPAEIAHGSATGADSMAGQWARFRGVPCREYLANWRPDGKKLDRGAGPKRNRRMFIEFKPTLVVAFPGGIGTDDMVRQAERAGVQVLRIKNGVATLC